MKEKRTERYVAPILGICVYCRKAIFVFGFDRYSVAYFDSSELLCGTRDLLVTNVSESPNLPVSELWSMREAFSRNCFLAKAQTKNEPYIISQSTSSKPSAEKFTFHLKSIDFASREVTTKRNATVSLWIEKKISTDVGPEIAGAIGWSYGQNCVDYFVREKPQSRFSKKVKL